MNIKIRISVIYSLCLIVLSSCNELVPNNPQSAEQAKMQAICSSVNLGGGLTEHSNAKQFLKCFSWDKKLPHLVEGVESVSSETWNYIFGPLDRVNFYNSKRRVKFFGRLHQLVEDKNVKYIEILAHKILSQEFFAVVNKVFTENPHDIKTLLSILSLEEDLFKHLNMVVAGLIEGLTIVNGQDKDQLLNFSQGLQELLAGDFKKLRHEVLLDLLKVIKDLSADDPARNILLKLLTTKTQSGSGWVEDYIKNKHFTFDEFKKLITSLEENQETDEILVDLQNILPLLEKNMSCEFQGKEGPLVLDLNKTFSDYTKKLATLNQGDFLAEYNFFVYDMLILADEACSLLTTLENKQVRVNKLLHKFTSMVQNPMQHVLLSYVHDVSIFRNDLNKEYPLFFLKIMGSEEFRKIHQLNKKITSLSDDKFLRLLFLLLKNIPHSSFKSLAYVVKYAVDPAHKKYFQALFAIWNNLEKTEQDLLWDLLDEHFLIKARDHEAFNLMSLLKFYQKIFSDFPEDLAYFHQSYALTDREKEKTIEAVKEFIKTFNTKDSLKDLRDFFSMDYMLKTLAFLARGVLPATDDDVLASFVLALESKLTPILIKVPTVSDEEKNLFLTKCINSLIDQKHVITVQDFIQDFSEEKFPKECRPSESHKYLNSVHVSYRLLYWLHYVNDDFKMSPVNNSFPEKNRPDIFDRTGLLGPDLLNVSLNLLKIIDEEFALRDKDGKVIAKGIDVLYELFKDLIKDPDNYDLIKNALINLSELPKGSLDKYLQKTGHLLIELQTDEKNQMPESELAPLLVTWTNSTFHLLEKIFPNKEFKKFIKLTKKVIKNSPSKTSKEFSLETFSVLKEYLNTSIKEKKYAPKQSCEEYFGLEGPNKEKYKLEGRNEPGKLLYRSSPCPGKEEFKAKIFDILKKGIRIFPDKNGKYVGEKGYVGGGNYLEETIALMHPFGGVKIVDHDKKIHLLTKDLMKFIWDINHTRMQKNFFHGTDEDDGKHRKMYRSSMSLADQLEILLKEIDFGNGYYGLNFFNFVATKNDVEKDYKSKIRKQRSLLGALIPLSGIFRHTPALKDFFPEDTTTRLFNLRGFENEVNTNGAVDALLDIDRNGLTYGNLMAAVFTVHSKTSSVAAQNILVSEEDFAAISTNPGWKDAALDHNAQVAIVFSELGGYRKAGYLFEERISYDKDEFHQFLEDEKFKRVNYLIGKFDLKKLQAFARLVVNEYIIKPAQEKRPSPVKNLISDFIDPYFDENIYDRVRKSEIVLAKSMYVASFLGAYKEKFPEMGTYFMKNDLNSMLSLRNMDLLFMIVDKLKAAQLGAIMDHLLPKADGFLNILVDRLSKNNKNTYFMVNTFYKLVQRMLLAPPNSHYEKNRAYIINKFFHMNPELLSDAGQLLLNLENTFRHHSFKARDLSYYFEKINSKFLDQDKKIKNPHFQEMTRLVKYLVLPHDAENKQVLKWDFAIKQLEKNGDDKKLFDFLKDLMEFVQIKSP